MRFSNLSSSLISFFILTCNLCQSKEIVKVETKLGTIVGRVEKFNDKEYSAFYGVPYAKPPIGKLRFSPPEPIEVAWKDELDLSKYAKIVCPQTDIFFENTGKILGQEDCLILNVYIPKKSFDKKDLLIPVMVYIHGGAFVSGSGDAQMLGPQYFMEANNVILVTINYRLGMLGFMSTGDDVVSGNMGLKDQTMALKWIQANIEAFCGDPGQVTIFGASAGGISVAAHLLSPWSTGLFHRVIIQSGGLVRSPFMHMSKNASFYSQRVAEELGFEDDESSEQIVNFLRSKPFEEIVSKSEMFNMYYITGIPWLPIVDDFSKRPFISDDFNTLFMFGNYNKVPAMIGGTSEEGSMFIAQFIKDESLFEKVNDDFDTQGPVLFLGVHEDDVTEQDSATTNIILRHYLPGPDFNLSMTNLRPLMNIFTDTIILAPINIQTKLLQRTLEDHPLYYYSYRFKDELNVMKLMGIPPSFKFDFGVGHGDDLFVLFHQAALEASKSPNMQLMTSKIINLWTRFALTGNPDSNWTPVKVDEGQPSYAILDLKALRIENEKEFAERMALMENLLDLNNYYRSLNFLEHPAVVERLKVRDEEEQEEMDLHDEL